MGKSLVIKILDKQNKLNKISLFAIRYSLFAIRYSLFAIRILIPLYLIPLFLISISTLNAQVIIKEKVEINPSSIVTPDDPVNSYYCNHIYYPYYYQNTYGEMQCLRSFCDTSIVWYGEDFYNFCFLPTVTKSINVVEGSEYIQIYLGYVPSTSETGSCFDCTEYFVTTDNLFLQPDGECTYIKFNEAKPIDTAFVKIIVTDYSDEVYTFNVFVVNPVFTLFDYTYDHNLKRNTEITLDVCASPQFGYSLNLPDTTKYNVEIVSGIELGNIVNVLTGDSGLVLNDLPHSYGCLDQIILRTNDQIQADDEIKILISTSDPSIEPIEITFTNLLVVNIVPETISPGDTAQIIPKLKNPDGSLSDFPIEQTFEIGMLDGCALGMIKTATDSGLYVDSALQPFFFIADTGAVEGTVKLRVGVIEGMSSSSLLNNNFKSRKSKYQIKKSSASDNHIEAQSFIDGGVVVEYCFLGDLYSVVTGDANVVVKNNCDFESCGETNYENNFIVLNRQQNNFKYTPTDTVKVCDLSNPSTNTDDVGQSRPIPIYQRKREELSWANSWEIDPCTNSYGKVQFSIVTPDRILPANLYFDFIEAVCEDIITNDPNNGIIIRDLGLSGVNSGKEAMSDFCGHQAYPIITGSPNRGGYYIWEVIRTHEGIHGDRFLKILNNNWIELRKELTNFSLKCEEYNSKYWGEELVGQHIENLIKTFYIKCYNQYFAENNEQDIQCHSEIRQLIKDYMNRVNVRFGTPLPTFQCYTCANN